MIMTFYFLYLNSINRYQVVDPSTISHTSNLLFIRKDCSECQELLREERHQLKGMTIVDLSLKGNRQYIEQFGIISVPTLFVNQHEYMGVDDIKQYLKGGDECDSTNYEK